MSDKDDLYKMDHQHYCSRHNILSYILYDDRENSGQTNPMKDIIRVNGRKDKRNCKVAALLQWIDSTMVPAA